MQDSDYLIKGLEPMLNNMGARQTQTNGLQEKTKIYESKSGRLPKLVKGTVC